MANGSVTRVKKKIVVMKRNSKRKKMMPKTTKENTVWLYCGEDSVTGSDIWLSDMEMGLK